MTKTPTCLFCGRRHWPEAIFVEWGPVGFLCDQCVEKAAWRADEARRAVGSRNCAVCEYLELARLYPRENRPASARGLCRGCAQFALEIIGQERRRRNIAETPRFALRSLFLATGLVAVLFALLRLADFHPFWVALAVPWVVIFSEPTVRSFFNAWRRKRLE